ncbi:TPA: hypothetical protein KOR49_002376 [Clostridioides difficile]|uniref:Uncharacterized protein n=1 Tax=Clostridioides difficile TaxID=1496 RepID=A0AAN6A5T3_CLODI|nr:hypothetical protein [Clostridioides difficile]EGT3944920.1 hypothetical protein [Clostridioides difficile]MBG0198786.1 hypothetical protein [Clostridioides difficile]MCA0574571.1 hypothetical protein [Clostridioides difficile]MDW0076876.1 hypothetical protein [Clostridioides difficile]PBG30492.1 hypothetical protein BGU81_02480 [Clostridioides difficile]
MFSYNIYVVINKIEGDVFLKSNCMDQLEFNFFQNFVDFYNQEDLIEIELSSFYSIKKSFDEDYYEQCKVIKGGEGLNNIKKLIEDINSNIAKAKKIIFYWE